MKKLVKKINLLFDKMPIHPLFILFLIWFTISRKIFSFFVFILALLIHEFGHYIFAKKLGYRLSNFKLMPFGAELNYEGRFFDNKDEALIAFAGPLLNILTSIFVVCFWWLFPTLYAFTYHFVVESMVLALINLLPAYPLDGGRIILGIINDKIDLSKLGCYQNGKEISISLELENPTGKEGIYSAVEKTIVVDTSIYDISGESYSTTTEELFNKIKDFSNAINLENLRTFLDISGVGTTDKDKVSFSQTVASDFYRYYAYQVNKDFFTNLESVVENNKTNNLNGKTSVYLRDVGANIYSSAFEETSHDAFFTTNPVFNELSEFIQNLTTGHYYEIIECDYAGNLNIYLVYYLFFQ